MIEQSIELKSIHALRIEELIGTTPSCTDWILIAVPPAVDRLGTQQLGAPVHLRPGEAVSVDHDDVRAVVAEACQGRRVCEVVRDEGPPGGIGAQARNG